MGGTGKEWKVVLGILKEVSQEFGWSEFWVWVMGVTSGPC